MKAELRCAEARAQLSALMDEPDSRPDPTLSEHLDGCDECRHFADQLHVVRRSLRLQAMEPVPDLTGSIMERVRSEVPVLRRKRVAAFRVRIAAVAAVVAALAVIGASLPFGGTPPQSATASELVDEIRADARALTEYHAQFTIVETGWHPDVPKREFTAELWFRAPEEMRLVMRDRTHYPSRAWPRNDVMVLSDSASYSIQEPFSCPPEALPGCSFGTGQEVRTIVHRQPFDGTTFVPTDMIVPLESLAGSEDLRVLDKEVVDGREAYRVEAPYRQAWPLIASLQQGGSWAAISPDARVVAWLDNKTHFPLKFDVLDGSKTVLSVKATAFDVPAALPDDLFSSARRGVMSSGGFVSRAIDSRLAPDYTAGLTPYRMGTAIASGTKQLVLSYATGTTWLKIIVGGEPRRAFDTAAQVVDLRRGSKGYFLPASVTGARTLDIRGAGHYAHLTSNLPRAELLKVGASLRIAGAAPDSFRSGGLTVSRLPLSDSRPVPDLRLPSVLPKHYGLRAAYISTRDGGATKYIAYFSPPSSQLDPAGIRIVEGGVSSLAPTSEDLITVRIGDALGRWSPERSELEWVAEDGYRSVSAPSFDLRTVYAIARSIDG